MALTDLLQKIAPQKGLFAVEKISLIYNLLTCVLILFLFREMENPARMLIDRAVIAALTLLLMYFYTLRPCKLLAFTRVGLQGGLLSYWYPDTFEFNRLFPNLDHVFASVEQWMFGGQPAVWFSERFPQMWVSEPLNLGYFFYYPMMLIVVLWYFIYRYDLFEKVSFVLVASFVVYYIIFIFVPVAGPQFYFPAIGDENVANGIFPAIGDYFHHNPALPPGPEDKHGFFYMLVEISQEVGERPTAAFPSSHVGISTVLMIMAFRGSRRLFCWLLPFYLLLCAATVYIQAHYLIDSIAGLLSAFLIYVVCTWAFKRWFVQRAFSLGSTRKPTSSESSVL